MKAIVRMLAQCCKRTLPSFPTPHLTTSTAGVCAIATIALLSVAPIAPLSASEASAGGVVDTSTNITPEQLWTQTELNLGAAARASEHFAWSVALSRDGHTALIGDAGRSVNGLSWAGAGYLYRMNNGGWGPPTELTLGNQAKDDDQLGASVALNADGNTAVLGAPSRGTAEVFRFTKGKWGAPVELEVGPYQPIGQAVAVSADGNTVLATDRERRVSGHSQAGAGDIFRFDNGMWSKPIELSLQNHARNQDFLGESAALSANGNTAIMGAIGRRVNGRFPAGTAEVFRFSSNQWSPATEFSVPTSQQMGESVSLSADGDIAAVGVVSDTRSNIPGSVDVFRYEDGTWGTPAELTAGAFPPPDNTFFGFGWSVALSSDGGTLVAGYPSWLVNQNHHAGAVAMFKFSGSSWSAPEELSLGSSARTRDLLGWSLGLSGDGSTILAGAPLRSVNDKPEAGSSVLFQTTELKPVTLAYTGPLFINRGKDVRLSGKLTAKGGEPISGRILRMQIGRGYYTQVCVTQKTTSEGDAGCLIKNVAAWKSPNPARVWFDGDSSGPNQEYASGYKRTPVTIVT